MLGFRGILVLFGLFCLDCVTSSSLAILEKLLLVSLLFFSWCFLRSCKTIPSMSLSCICFECGGLRRALVPLRPVEGNLLGVIQCHVRRFLSCSGRAMLSHIHWQCLVNCYVEFGLLLASTAGVVVDVKCSFAKSKSCILATAVHHRISV